MKIFSQYGVPAEGFSIPLKEHELIIPERCECFTREEALHYAAEADAVVATRNVDAELIACAPRLRIICAYGAGYDNIDIAAATKRGIPVCNVPDTVTEATAELALGLMLAVGRKICRANTELHQEKASDLFRMGRDMGFSLHGATLGIIGLGRIGCRVADLGRAFGMKILYTSRHRKPEREALGDCYCTLDELLRRSDVLSLNCPSTPETRGLIGARELSLMKKSAFLINTARGNVVRDEDLIAALRDKRIAGAGLDVFDGEPNAVHPGYLELDNVVLTPHIGSNTEKTRYDMAHAIGETILAVFSGKRPEHLINPEVWTDLHSIA